MSSARAFAFTAMPVSPVVCLASSALVAAKAIAISRCAAGSSAARRATAHGLSAASDCSTCSSVDSAEPAEPAVSKKDSAMLERYCNHQKPLKFEVPESSSHSFYFSRLNTTLRTVAAAPWAQLGELICPTAVPWLRLTIWAICMSCVGESGHGRPCPFRCFRLNRPLKEGAGLLRCTAPRWAKAASE